MAAAAAFGAPVTAELPAGGYDDPGSEAARVQTILADDFQAGGMPLIFEVTNPAGVDTSAVRQRADTVLNALRDSPYARQVASYWSSAPSIANSLVNSDHRTALIVAQISGADSEAPPRAHDIASKVTGTFDQTTVKAGGQSIAYYQINQQSRTDLVVIEAIAMPLTFLVLVWIFGSLWAAILPIIVAICAMAGTTAALRAVFVVTDVSVFALNLAISLCLALAIDYTLLIISRYREELGAGKEPAVALVTTVKTAGRTVVFSTITVALPLVVMVIFPLYFLRSLAYAGLIGVLLCLIGALVVAPALLVVLGTRIDDWDIRAPIYRILGRSAPAARAPQDTFFYRSAQFAMRHAVPVVILVTAFFVLLGAPFLGLKTAYPDDRLLPASASARQAGDTLRAAFPQQNNQIRVMLRSGNLSEQQVSNYAERLSRYPNVIGVASPQGAYVNGALASRDVYGAGRSSTATYLTVSSSLQPYSDAAKAQLNTLRGSTAPAPTLFGGVAAQNIDNVRAIISRVPLAFALIAAATLVLIFLLTGSVLLPIKTVVMNVMSLTAAFGAMVWIFQDGHLGGLGTTATGSINYAFPPLIFCIAFGLSMDYEVFVLSRIREEWLRTDRGPGANERAVAMGLARVGRIVTVAATVMAIVFVAIAASQVASMRMLGVGLAVTILLDAFLIRTVLVPAFMRLFGRANWWAPRVLRRVHDSWGLREELSDTPTTPHTAAKTDGSSLV